MKKQLINSRKKTFNSKRKIAFIVLASALAITSSTLVGSIPKLFGQNSANLNQVNNSSLVNSETSILNPEYIEGVKFSSSTEATFRIYGNGYDCSFSTKDIVPSIVNGSTNYRKVQNGNRIDHYINIALKEADNNETKKKYQYINICSTIDGKNKWIWDEGFLNSIDTLSLIRSAVLNDDSITSDSTLYVQYKQTGVSYEREVQRSSSGYDTIRSGTEKYNLPTNTSVSLSTDSVLTSKDATLSSNINCQETQIGSSTSNGVTTKYIKQVFSCNSGINFSVAFAPNTILTTSSGEEITLSVFIKQLKASKDLPISYGVQQSINDAIVVDNKSLASDFVNQNNSFTINTYASAINSFINKNASIKNPWNVSSVYDLTDPTLTTLNIKDKIDEIKNSEKLPELGYDNQSGLFYKVIKLDNAFNLETNRTNEHPVPWLWYLSNDTDGVSSYYLVKFETTGKEYNIEQLKYDSSSDSFYIDVSNFENLKNQLTNWSNTINFKYDRSKWVSALDNNSSKVSLPLPLNNDSNFVVDFTSSSNNESNLISSSLSTDIINVLLNKINSGVMLASNNVGFSYSKDTQTINFEVTKFSANDFKENFENGNITLSLSEVNDSEDLANLVVKNTANSSKINLSSTITANLTNKITNQVITQSLPFEIVTNALNWLTETNQYVYELQIEFDLTNVNKTFANYLFLDSSDNDNFVGLRNEFSKLLLNYLNSYLIGRLQVNNINIETLTEFKDATNAIQSDLINNKPYFSLDAKTIPLNLVNNLTPISTGAIVGISISTIIIIAMIITTILLLLIRKNNKERMKQLLKAIENNRPIIKPVDNNSKLLTGSDSKSLVVYDSKESKDKLAK